MQLPRCRFKLRTLLVFVGVVAVGLALTARSIHIPSASERRAIQIASKYYAAQSGTTLAAIANRCLIDARPVGALEWHVSFTTVVNPEPGGLRYTYTFKVQEHGPKVEEYGLIESGSY